MTNWLKVYLLTMVLAKNKLLSTGIIAVVGVWDNHFQKFPPYYLAALPINDHDRRNSRFLPSTEIVNQPDRGHTRRSD